MKPLVDLATWLLEKNIRAKNATGFFVALLSVVVLYFASRHAQWFQELDRRGSFALTVALLVAFLVAFLATWLIWSAIAGRHQRIAAIHEAERRRARRMEMIGENLAGLTDMQRRILLLFIEHRKTLIHEHEIGGYRVVWEPEVDVMVTKGIIIPHRRGVYEIHRAYYQYLMDFLNPEVGAME